MDLLVLHFYASRLVRHVAVSGGNPRQRSVDAKLLVLCSILDETCYNASFSNLPL